MSRSMMPVGTREPTDGIADAVMDTKDTNDAYVGWRGRRYTVNGGHPSAAQPKLCWVALPVPTHKGLLF